MTNEHHSFDPNVENFVSRLARPIMVYRFARGLLSAPGSLKPGHRRGAIERAETAEEDLRQAARDFVVASGMDSYVELGVRAKLLLMRRLARSSITSIDATEVIRIFDLEDRDAVRELADAQDREARVYEAQAQAQAVAADVTGDDDEPLGPPLDWEKGIDR